MTVSTKAAFDSAWSYASARRFEGNDPYDALRSPSLARLAAAGGRPVGILVTQLLRRMPFDVRRPLGIEPILNPKGLALFLSAAARIEHREEVSALAARLASSASEHEGIPAWGYPFPWQARAFFLPAGTPTVVATAFAVEALLDAHELTGESRWLELALRSCQFLDRLHRTDDSTGSCLSYSPVDRSAVYNASVLGARMLVRTSIASGRRELLEKARPLINYVLARQASDGAWAYGEARHHRWVDSFHTGFVLVALELWRRATGDLATASAVRRGFVFYRNNFFGPAGEPYYFAHRRWPYDIHSAAQGVLTCCALRDEHADAAELALRVGSYLIQSFLASDGHFIYQIRRTHRVTIPYMRWSQAWGTRALAELAASEIRP